MDGHGTIGLIGGLSWHSTAQYYRVINETVAQRRGGHASARISLQSLDFAEIRELQVAGAWDQAGDVLAAAARRCVAGGADVVLICANLMHRVADQVAAAVDVPLLHIADVAAEGARRAGWDRVGLLATRWVMEEAFYVERLAGHGLSVLTPPSADRIELDRIVFDELTQGSVRPSSRATLQRLIAELGARGAQGVLLACTELELLQPEQGSLPVLDTMRAHAEAAVDFVEPPLL